MSEERRMTITSSPLLAPDDVARHTFTTVRRGFDPKEVRAYLESLAHGLSGLAQREQELLEDLSATEHRAANPVLDEQTLMAALGQETARVLHSAHEVAEELEVKAREEAERLVSDASEQAEAARASAETHATERMSEVESAVAQLVEEAEARAAALVEATGHDRDELLERTKGECRAMLEEAQQLRSRVLADLSRRRRLLHAQIEQLRAGRERLSETIDGVRRSVDGIADDLSTAEDDAREAAETAGRVAAERAEDDGPDELAELLQAVAVRTLANDVEQPTAEGGDVQVGEVVAVVQPADPGAASDEGPDVVIIRTADPDASGSGRAPTEKVDALFAKLRADQTVEGSNGGPVEGGGGGDEGGGVDFGPEVAADAENAQAETPPEDPDEGAGPPDDRPAAAVQRDELIEPVVAALARRLKRSLQDTQNDLLDHLRSNRSEWSPTILPEETEQVDGLTTAVLPMLEEAAVAGVSFAGGAEAATPSADDVVAVAHELAEEVVVPLRRRLANDSGVAEAGETAAVEHVGAAFRDWRGPRVERLAGDYAVAAFSLGSMTAVQRDSDGRLEWISVPGTSDEPCPDCEDNGLAGPQPPGDEFPTGHRHPPAHSGCRCLVAPAAP